MMFISTVAYAIRRTNSCASAGNATPGHAPNVVFGALIVPKADTNTTFAGDVMRLAGIFGRSKRKCGLVGSAGERVSCMGALHLGLSCGAPLRSGAPDVLQVLPESWWLDVCIVS